MPDTFDVDRAFEALAQEVMHRAAPSAAVTAIKQAQCRRRTALVTAAAAALVVMAGFVVPTMVGGDDSSPVAERNERPLPVPVTFAPQGWEPLTGTDPLFPRSSTCLTSFLRPVPQGLGRGNYSVSELGRGDDRLVSWFMEFEDDLEDAEDAADQVVADTASWSGCGASTPVPQYADADVQHFTTTEDGTATDLWVARTVVDGPGLIGLQHRVGLSLAVSTTPATSEEVATIADSLVTSLRGDLRRASEVTRPSSEPVLRAAEAEGKRLLNDVDTAFGAWSPGWREADSPSFGLCAQPPLRGDPNPFLEGWWVDWATDSDVDVDFNVWRTDDEATTGRAAFLSRLADCTAYEWKVESSGPSTWIATSHLGTVWIVQDAEAFGVLRARGAIDPPDDVRAAVSDVLTSALQARPRP